MRILVLNSGSATVKFEILETDAERIAEDHDRRIVRGLLDGIGGRGRVRIEAGGIGEVDDEEDLPDHRAAVDRILSFVRGAGPSGGPGLAVDAVGHRVVHGGERFRDAVRIDDEVIAGIEACIELAPLHNPANLRGIRAVRDALGPDLPQVAVFDTAFHATLPEVSATYAIPRDLRERLGVRRYGFHGISHQYLTERCARLLGIPRARADLITLHLGNGCSACAVRGGASFDTSMGMTPLEGLVMGTRSGDLDPSIVEYLVRRAGMAVAEIDEMLNRRSGLLGLSGRSRDMRELLEVEPEDPRAGLAIDVFCHRAKKYVGAYFAALGGARALVFSGGIGENSPEIRRRICDGLACLGLSLDPGRNAAASGSDEAEISTADSTLRAFVIRTDEELMIARETWRLVRPPSRG
jgi:acetate kinase